LKEAIRLSPETAELHLQLGTVYSESGNPQAAEQEYVVLLNLNPNYAVQLRSVMDENKDKKKNH
jgi:Flp pilus assembly protein TadD